MIKLQCSKKYTLNNHACNRTTLLLISSTEVSTSNDFTSMIIVIKIPLHRQFKYTGITKDLTSLTPIIVPKITM